MRISGIVLLFVLITGFIGFQSSWTVTTVDEVDAAHKTSATFYAAKKKYSMEITYSSFKGHDELAPYETMEGYYHYDNGKSHSYIQGVHSIISGNYKLILDSAHKTMVIADAPNESTGELMQINYENSKQYMTSCKKLATEISTSYRMEFSEEVTYSAYALTFAKDGQMKDITVYYRKEYPSDPKQPNSPKLKPKLKISYGVLNEKAVFGAKEFDLTKYFTESKGQLKATPAYSTYQLIDSRAKH